MDEDRRELPPLDPPGEDPSDASGRPAGLVTASPDDPVDQPGDGVDLSALSIAGITKRRVGWLAVVLVSAWIVVIFARQTSEATDAANRADQIARDNAALAAEVAALEEELRLIERPAYVAQQAHGYGLGSPNEIPFTLAPSVPAPDENAPGSASGRVGAPERPVTPLESWLSLLFGPVD